MTLLARLQLAYCQAKGITLEAIPEDPRRDETTHRYRVATNASDFGWIDARDNAMLQPAWDDNWKPVRDRVVYAAHRLIAQSAILEQEEKGRHQARIFSFLRLQRKPGDKELQSHRVSIQHQSGVWYGSKAGKDPARDYTLLGTLLALGIAQAEPMPKPAPKAPEPPAFAPSIESQLQNLEQPSGDVTVAEIAEPADADGSAETEIVARLLPGGQMEVRGSVAHVARFWREVQRQTKSQAREQSKLIDALDLACLIRGAAKLGPHPFESYVLVNASLKLNLPPEDALMRELLEKFSRLKQPLLDFYAKPRKPALRFKLIELDQHTPAGRDLYQMIDPTEKGSTSVAAQTGTTETEVTAGN